MPTGKNLGKRSTSSKKNSNAAEVMTERGKRLVESLRQATAYAGGERKLAAYTYNVPGHVDVRAVREKTGLSQREFAAVYALNARTLQQWEQGRAQPDLATRAYLTVISRNPDAVLEALSAR